MAWNIIKNTPNTIVTTKASVASFKFLRAIALCAHVTANPETIKIIVFNKG